MSTIIFLHTLSQKIRTITFMVVIVPTLLPNVLELVVMQIPLISYQHQLGMIADAYTLAEILMHS
jgi:hypothetical protein